jgi:hypothetical protein
MCWVDVYRSGSGLVLYRRIDMRGSTTQGTVVNAFAYNANGDQTVAPGNRTSSSVGGVTTRFDWDAVNGGLGDVTAEYFAGSVVHKYAYGLETFWGQR